MALEVKKFTAKYVRWQRAGLVISVAFILTFLFLTFFKIFPENTGTLDFNVYYYAGEYVREGKEIYGPFVSGPFLPREDMPFTYTPFAAILFSVFTFFSLRASLFVVTFLGVLCLVYLVKVVLRAGWVGTKLSLVGAGVFFSLMPVGQNFQLGQINMLLVAACVADFVRSPSSRFGRCCPPGVLVGLAAAIKMTPAFLVLYMCVIKRWRMAAWAVATGIATLVVSAVVLPQETLRFFTQAMWDNQDRVIGQYMSIAHNNSFRGLLAFLGVDSFMVYGAVLALVAAAILWIAGRVYRDGEGLAAVLIVGMGTCLISPVSWLHHWVWLVPALVYCLVYRRRLGFTVAASSFLVIALSWPAAIQYESVGDHLIIAHPLLAPVGFVLRYSVLFTGLALIAVLAWGPRPTRQDQWFLPRAMQREFFTSSAITG